MKKEELAQILNGRIYGKEMTADEEKSAKENGLVVVTGYSDDNCEFRGVIDDEAGCYDGGKIVIFKHKDQWNVWDADEDAIEDMEDSRKEVAALDAVKKEQVIDALWCPESLDCSWAYETKIPHATFDIMSDGELYCRGIVFEISSLT